MKKYYKALISAFLTIIIFSAAAFSQTTEFVYQGQLQNASKAANGSFDFEFLLFDALKDGKQIGKTLTQSGVAVANGAFSVKLDFGPNFPGADRFLEIHVQETGGGGFTTLMPRQAISSSPYAIKTLNADSAANSTNADQLAGLTADHYVLTTDPRMSDSRSPTAGSANYVQNTTSLQAAANFNVSGNGTAGGTLSGNIINATSQYNIGGSRVLGIPGTGNTFAGVSVGISNTSGSGNSFFGNGSGSSITTGSFNSFFGVSAGTANTNGSQNIAIGYAANAGGNLFQSHAIAIGASSQAFYDNATAIGTNAHANGTNATAIGADATATVAHTILIGTSAETTIVPGYFSVGTVPSGGGGPSLCINGGAVISYCSSSLRYKTNLAPYRRGLDIVNSLNPITFDWKQDGKHDLGFGAEDVEKVDPLLVFYNTKGQVEGVKYDRISAALVNAVKEQQSQIDEQKKTIERQQTEMNELKQIVCELKPTAKGCSPN